MEHRFNQLRIHPDGPGQLLAGQGASLLPQDGGDLDALRLGEFGDPSTEEPLAFRFGFSVQFRIAPFLQEGAGTLFVLLGQVFLRDV